MATYTYTDGVAASAGYPSEDYATNLETTRLNVSKLLAEITANPKPSYNVNGQAVNWTEYHKMLTETLSRLNKLIAEGEVDATPFEEVSQGFS